MKALGYSAYGSPDVVTLDEVARPAPGDDDVLVRVRAASVNPYDWHFLRGEPYLMRLMFGLSAPKSRALGADLSGVVEAVGKNVAAYRPGDAVIGIQHGAFAEYVCAKATVLGPKPESLTFEEAATVPMAGLTALQGLRDVASLQPGQRVLIIGASGGVGTYAVQLAKHLGAHVTAVCSARNADFVRSLGADETLDYATTDFLRPVTKYDVVFQLAGKQSALQCRRALTPRGVLVLSSGDSDGRWLGPIVRLLVAALVAPFVSQRLRQLNTRASTADLVTLKTLIESGTLKPIVDRVVSLADAAHAIGEVERGHTRGKVAVCVAR